MAQFSKSFVQRVNELPFRDEYRMIMGKSAPSGKMFCPFHHNTETPAAKIYGNRLKCFSCNRTYGTFDLLRTYAPDRLTELARTLEAAVEADSVASKKKPVKFTPPSKVNREQSISVELLDSLIK